MDGLKATGSTTIVGTRPDRNGGDLSYTVGNRMRTRLRELLKSTGNEGVVQLLWAVDALHDAANGIALATFPIFGEMRIGAHPARQEERYM